MPAFLVDASTLLDVRDGLGRLHHDLLAVPAVASAYEGTLGSPVLQAQLQTFCAACGQSVVDLGASIEAVMRNLADAAAAYERADAAARTGAHRAHATTRHGRVRHVAHRSSRSGWAIISVGPHGVRVVASGPGSPPAHRAPAGSGHGSGTTTIGGGGGSTTSTSSPGSRSGTGSGTVTIG